MSVLRFSIPMSFLFRIPSVIVVYFAIQDDLE